MSEAGVEAAAAEEEAPGVGAGSRGAADSTVSVTDNGVQMAERSAPDGRAR